MKTFPTLYKRTSTGALQEWTVFATGVGYYVRFGQVGGAIQQSEVTVCAGKNAGKTNATTQAQQAELEAEALWTKKLKKDYTQDPNVKAGDKSELIEGGILPMLAHKFSEHGDKLKYPCFVQPKLDGHRCIAIGGKLWSRTRKPINSVPHIVAEIGIMAPGAKIILDGELYNHTYHDRFEELSHFIRQTSAATGCEIVQYHVYDAPDPFGKCTFRQRYEWLKQHFNEHSGGAVTLVETREVHNEDELMLAFEDFLEQGYEGAVARNTDGLYVNKRSYDLLKIKRFDDGEFRIVGVAEGKGKLAGHGIFLCTTKPDTPDFGVVTADQAAAIILANPGVFSAKMKGATVALRQFIANYPAYAGKMLTVKYQGYTNKNKVPRFPVALRVREDV